MGCRFGKAGLVGVHSISLPSSYSDSVSVSTVDATDDVGLKGNEANEGGVCPEARLLIGKELL